MGEEAWWEEVGKMKEERERMRKELQDARQRVGGDMSKEDHGSDEEDGADLGKDRTTCLLIGNHSAGKSSFVNWYVGEKVQVESVAMETAGFCLIRKGGKRARWKGRQTSSAFPWLRRAAHGRTIEWTYADNTIEEERLPARKNFYCMAFKAAGGIPFAILLLLGTALSIVLSLRKTRKQQTMSPSDVVKLRKNRKNLEQVTIKNIEELRKKYVRHTLEEEE
ncbi:hypothetical protein GUITHDRAFT_131710 [Guillardia theta CCMP2712]|uniref:G domain-containing protein n=1 Tax=Guillardia theta (strain CCMP2712) TaxID=905079 RepID=L1K3Y1_GUITC|nr:hypothetical protein GUITHDRAFT_131710 [Guillardia theta CCMP2712]EKX55536.1 hypothetical protein GUITHDRAFT_131710 [Guillardia theta CCMP2712]|eukprot:XP_005842516.1 hypothetical protein GUITHDRAFT_131710 [Guillardia theta CCMP2712]